MEKCTSNFDVCIPFQIPFVHLHLFTRKSNLSQGFTPRTLFCSLCNNFSDWRSEKKPKQANSYWSKQKCSFSNVSWRGQTQSSTNLAFCRASPRFAKSSFVNVSVCFCFEPIRVSSNRRRSLRAYLVIWSKLFYVFLSSSAPCHLTFDLPRLFLVSFYKPTTRRLPTVMFFFSVQASIM